MRTLWFLNKTLELKAVRVHSEQDPLCGKGGGASSDCGRPSTTERDSEPPTNANEQHQAQLQRHWQTAVTRTVTGPALKTVQMHERESGACMHHSFHLVKRLQGQTPGPPPARAR